MRYVFTIAQPRDYSFFYTNFHTIDQRRKLLRWLQMRLRRVETAKECKFSTKNRYISETVKDRHRVTIVDCNSNVRTDFPRLVPISVTLNHFERPQRTTAPYSIFQKLKWKLVGLYKRPTQRCNFA